MRAVRQPITSSNSQKRIASSLVTQLFRVLSKLLIGEIMFFRTAE